MIVGNMLENIGIKSIYYEKYSRKEIPLINMDFALLYSNSIRQLHVDLGYLNDVSRDIVFIDHVNLIR